MTFEVMKLTPPKLLFLSRIQVKGLQVLRGAIRAQPGQIPVPLQPQFNNKNNNTTARQQQQHQIQKEKTEDVLETICPPPFVRSFVLKM